MPDGIYVLGGYDGHRYLNQVEKLDITRNEWIALTPLLTGRCSFSYVSDNKQIVIVGGYNGQTLDLVESYKVGEDVWRQLPSLPSGRYMHSCVLLPE